MSRLHDLSPLTEGALYTLVALDEPLHGYGIMQKVERMSNGRVKIGAGTLYGVLENLSRLKLIKPTGHDCGDRRKTYEITGDGKELLAIEVARLEEMLANARAALGR